MRILPAIAAAALIAVTTACGAESSRVDNLDETPAPTATSASPATAAPFTPAASVTVKASPSKPSPSKTTKPAAKKTTKAPPPEVYYKNCTAVRAAGAAPIRRGEPGYGSHLDRDGDGIACEN